MGIIFVSNHESTFILPLNTELDGSIFITDKNGFEYIWNIWSIINQHFYTNMYVDYCDHDNLLAHGL